MDLLCSSDLDVLFGLQLYSKAANEKPVLLCIEGTSTFSQCGPSVMECLLRMQVLGLPSRPPESKLRGPLQNQVQQAPRVILSTLVFEKP